MYKDLIAPLRSKEVLPFMTSSYCRDEQFGLLLVCSCRQTSLAVTYLGCVWDNLNSRIMPINIANGDFMTTQVRRRSTSFKDCIRLVTSDDKLYIR